MTVVALPQRRVYTVIISAILTIRLAKKLKILRRKTTASCAPPPQHRPAPTHPLDVLMSFREQEQTKKPFGAMLNMPGEMYSIYALKQHHFGLFSGNIHCGTTTKDADESRFAPTAPPTSTLRYFYCMSYWSYTGRVFSIKIFRMIPTLW